MKQNITKSVKEEAKKIIDNFGYWSDETRDFLSGFKYSTRNKLNEKMQVYSKYRYGL